MTSQTRLRSYKAYLGDLIGGSLMLKESQIVAELLLKNPTQEEWLEVIVHQNVLQKRSDASAKRNAATIKKRLKGMSDEYLKQIAYGSTELSTQLMFAATIINSTLLADFMRNVVLDAKRMFRESLDVGDWESFWDDRSRLFLEFAQMSDSSSALESKITELLRKGVMPESITILSPFSYEKSSISSLTKKLQNQIIKLDDYSVRNFPPKGISFAEIKNFKGLENEVIIVVDLTSPEKLNGDDKTLHYVAMSRARGLLSLIWI